MVDYADNQFDSGRAPFRLRRRWSIGLASGMRGGPRRLRRLMFAFVTFVLTVGFIACCAGGLLFWRLAQGPIAVGAETQVEKALSAHLRHGFSIEVGGTDIESVDGRPALAVKQLLVKDASGRAVLRAPQAIVSIDPIKMLSGIIEPTRLDVRDVTLKLSILSDGAVALSAGSDEVLPFRLTEAFETLAPGPGSKAPADTAGVEQPTADPNTAPDGPLAKVAGALGPLLDALTGESGALSGFDRLGVERGILVLDDRAHNSVRAFRNLSFDFDKPSEGVATVALSADGAAGRWSVSLRGSRQADGSRSLAFDTENVTLDDVRAVPGFAAAGFDSDVAVAASAEVGLDPHGVLTQARGRLRIGSGFFRLNDPDFEPVLLDAVESAFHFDPAASALVVEPSTIDAGTTSYTFEGKVLVPKVASADWTVTAAAKGVFGAERPNEKPIVFDTIAVSSRFNSEGHHLSIDRLDVEGPQVALSLVADIRSDDAGLKINTTAKAGRMPAPVIIRLWPSLISAQVRSWLLANLQGGTLEHGTATVSLDDADLAKIKAQHSVADGHLRLDYAVSDVTLSFMAGIPPLHGLFGTGFVTGDTSTFSVTRGVMDVAPGRQLTLPEGSLVVPSTDPKPTPAVITAHVVGGLDVLADLLSRDALKSYAGLPSEAANAKGQIDGTLTVGLNLGAKTKADDLNIGANAKISGLTIEKIVGKQNLTDGTIGLVLDKTGLKAKGEASLFGAPTSIDIRKPAGTAPGEANVVLTLDDAARAKAGFTFGRSMTGPVTAKLSMPLAAPDHKAAIELDLTRATLANVLPGVSKAAGKPGKITLTAAQRDDGVDLDSIVCDIGALSVRGSADLDVGGGFKSAHLTQARLSPGDDMKVDVSQGADALKIVARGANLDARPFLKALAGTDGPDTPAKDIDLDLHSNLLTGQNSQVLTNMDLRLIRRGGQIRKLQLNGKFGRAPVSIVSTPQGSVLNVVISSADAGASLLFLDLYRRVSGGQLDTAIRMMDGRMDGNATIHDFELREDPAMKKLTEESLSQAKSGDTHIDASNLNFTKLLMTFSKVGSKVDVKDGAIFGPQMGATVQGTIDFAREKVALSGTFVPIYGVNNLFSQLPLVGPILGGGAHEGLFGLNYKISGTVSTPNLTIDPLSALAPGFLRKIFGAISDATEQNSAPTPRSTAPAIDPVAR